MKLTVCSRADKKGRFSNSPQRALHRRSLMAVSPTAPHCYSLSTLHSSLFPSFKPRSILSFYTKPKRVQRRFVVRASTTLESSNGAIVAEESGNSTSYGRQFFPLAAVVGQVSFFLNTFLLVALFWPFCANVSVGHCVIGVSNIGSLRVLLFYRFPQVGYCSNVCIEAGFGVYFLVCC